MNFKKRGICVQLVLLTGTNTCLTIASTTITNTVEHPVQTETAQAKHSFLTTWSAALSSLFAPKTINIQVKSAVSGNCLALIPVELATLVSDLRKNIENSIKRHWSTTVDLTLGARKLEDIKLSDSGLRTALSLTDYRNEIDIERGEAVIRVTLFNRDLVLTASRDETAKIWNVSTGKYEKTLSGHTDSVNSAVFSADGDRVLTASRDETAKIWNVSTGKKCERTLSGHSGCVNSAVFSADGDWVVTASNDKTAKIWNVSTGECEQTMTLGPWLFKKHGNMSSAVFFR